MFALRMLVGFTLASAPAHGRTVPTAPAPESGPQPAAPAGGPSEPKPPPANPELPSFDTRFPGGISRPARALVVIGGVEYDPARLEPVARDFFANGQYQEALDAYTLWTPRSWCGNCLFSMRDIRYRGIALCQSHLGNHVAAARACLEAAGKEAFGDDGAATFLVQLYREAGQLGDLGPLLDAAEIRILDKKHPKPWLLTPTQRAERLAFTGAATIRHVLKSEQLGRAKPWPDGVPKPKPGSLPKALPK